jgi:hypothetical protein
MKASYGFVLGVAMLTGACAGGPCGPSTAHAVPFAVIVLESGSEAPIADAMVTLDNVDNGNTDRQGVVRVSVPYGNHLVLAAKAGYQADQLHIITASEAEVSATITIHLTR